MKYLLILFLYLLGLVLSLWRHNTNEKYTKILEKVKPNYDLCNEDNCPNNRGTCSGENFCFCFDGFISTFQTSSFCDYKQKDRVLYFILEFVLSFGMGHFYAGNYIYGMIKFIAYILIFGLYFGKFHKKKGIDAARIRLFLWLIFTLWQMIDSLCIGRGIYTDGKGKQTGFIYF